MVLVKMLMEIDPLPMRGSLVMTMVMISPSRRDVSPAEQLRQSPRLVLPRGGGVSSRELAYDFFPGRKNSYSKRWAPEACQGAHEAGAHPGGRARPPPSWPRCGPPSGTFFAQYFYILWKKLPWSFRTFGAVQNRSLIFAPFPAQNPSCRHSASLCKPCKIRENRHKYCDITCNNNP